MSEVLLNPSQPRTIVLHDRSKTFTFRCRRVRKEDYLAYFAAFRITSEQTSEGRETTADYQTASVVLAERVIQSVDGYKLSNGGRIEDLPEWTSRIPLAHRMQVGITLCQASATPPADDEYVISPAGDEVSIEAVWPGDDGRMLRFTGLKHIFRPPTPAQHKRYRDASTRSMVIGGSRTGKTIHFGGHFALVELYDELILSVDGYGVGGSPLTSREQIQDEMDAFHKFIAAKEIFDPNLTAFTADPDPQETPAA